MPGGLVTIGEVRTGLLHHSAAVSSTLAARLLEFGPGERVLRHERPISYVMSPPRLTGLDCLLPTSSGAKVRGIGTAITRAIITGGHILQGSAYVTVTRSGEDRRLPWSHYLSRPGLMETLGKVDGASVADGFLSGAPVSGYLNLGAIARRIMDNVQDREELDHTAAFPSTRTALRWVVGPADAPEVATTFAVQDETTRLVRLPCRDLDIAAQVAVCEDLAVHDWLLTTLLTLIERSRIGAKPRAQVIDRLRPAIDYLLHLWMPAARTHHALADIWPGLERRPGFTRQWQSNVDRVRDQLALGTIERLGTGEATKG